ncbi:MAG: Bcr/CflA family drug resistance efflux transporter [Candidatus Mesenet longicola]|uniref:Bcr/CflA family efflux transporter n=1 Tax=Candidatus Mesenet longicola TaxID=1892558 RepID=A0A8J3HYC1_9RICK|nr:MAG: Bcr/CflA family drug resistance efflux transporter [Candidatus Mesenet longicola]
MIIVDMSIYIYISALPKIGEYFKVQDSTVQLTISLYLIGFAISGLIYGPLSDYYGRRKVMLVGMAIFALASVICSLVESIMCLILIRFIQGFGAGVAGVVGYAAIKDMYSGYECSRVMSKLNMIAALSPAVAPIIGSNIISYGYSWRFIFIIISVLSILIFLLLYLKFKESINKLTSETDLLRNILKRYIEIFKHYKFLSFIIINSLTIMWSWAYMGNLPFILIKSMNISTRGYGYFFAIMVTSYIVGNAINRKYVEKVGLKNMLLIGLLLPLISDLSLFFLYYQINLTVIIMMFFWMVGNIGIAFVMSNSVTFALSEIQEYGLGSALLAFMQMTFGSIGMSIIGYFNKNNSSIVPNLLLTIACSIVAIVIYLLLHFKLKLNFLKHLKLKV